MTVAVISKKKSEGSKTNHLSGTIFTEQSITIAVVETDLRSFDQETAMERECVRVDFDIPTFLIGNKDTSSTPTRWIINKLEN